MSNPVFLSAYWRHLALLNYEIAPEVLQTHLPSGTEIDYLNGKTYISLVAFRFENTALFGKIPALLHRNFEEVNLRFYVLRKDKSEIKRGVVFIKEIVPKPLLAWIARRFYNENYVAMPMWSDVNIGSRYSYGWGIDSLALETSDQLVEANEQSAARWITEHYWGYTKVAQNRTYEYEVKHPVWNLYDVKSFRLNADIGSLYGDEFKATFDRQPSSVFLADGSIITVHWPSVLNF